jgi:hypothetical protein
MPQVVLVAIDDPVAIPGLRHGACEHDRNIVATLKDLDGVGLVGLGAGKRQGVVGRKLAFKFFG